MDPNRYSRVKVRCGLKTYRIPVDESGYVPLWALVERYQEVGDGADRNETAPVVLPSRVTPEQIVRWWADPRSCDISGVDTRDPEIYRIPDNIKGRKRTALRRVGIISDDPRESDRIRTDLADSFTARELEEMTAGRSFIVNVERNTGRYTGYYIRSQPGVRVPQIVYEGGVGTDAHVHEAVHHMRAVDGRTTFPTDRKGRLSRFGMALSRRRMTEIVSDEERQTTAETVIRTDRDRQHSGYYDMVGGKDPRRAYLEDRRTLSEERRCKGTAAIRRLNENYGDSNIARAEILSRNVRKRKK